MKEALSIALYVEGLTFVPAACLEIWLGVIFPMHAATASFLVLTGMLVRRHGTGK